MYVVPLPSDRCEEPETPVAQVKTYPLQVIAPAVAAEELPASPATAANPKLYLQVGAFTQWNNAVTLRNRLEREALRPISIQPSQAAKGNGPDDAHIYRVRVGPLTNVEEGDRLTERAAQLGVPNARLVVE